MEDEDDDDLPEMRTTPLDEVRMAHANYLKAVNHPTRRRILEILYKEPVSKETLVQALIKEKMLSEPRAINFHLDLLLKANCIKISCEGEKKILEITQEGKVVDYLGK